MCWGAIVHGSVRTSSSSWGRSSQQKHKEISLPFTHVTRYMNTPPLSAGGRPARANLSPCSLSPTPDVGRRVLQGLGGGRMWSLSVCVCWWGGCGALCTDTCVCVCAYALRRKVGGRGWGGGMIVVDEFIIKDMAPSTLSPLLSHCIVTNRPHEA